MPVFGAFISPNGHSRSQKLTRNGDWVSNNASFFWEIARNTFRFAPFPVLQSQNPPLALQDSDSVGSARSPCASGVVILSEIFHISASRLVISDFLELSHLLIFRGSCSACASCIYKVSPDFISLDLLRRAHTFSALHPDFRVQNQ